MTYHFNLTYGIQKANLLLIPITIQDKTLCMILDTGSNINILDTKVYNYFFINKSCLGTGWDLTTKS